MFSTRISGIKCKRLRKTWGKVKDLEWGTFNYGFWKCNCAARPLSTTARNIRMSLKWGEHPKTVSVRSQLLLIWRLVCYRACLKVQLCIVFTHVSCHRLRLCIYIYIYSYVYYIFIYLTLVDPCTCGNEQGGKQNRSDFALSETRTLRREHNSHTTQAHTHTQTKSGVRYTGLYTGGVILQKLEGKVGKDGVLERALASQWAPDQVVDSKRTPAGACPVTTVWNSTMHWMHRRACQRGKTMSAENTRVRPSDAGEASHGSRPEYSRWSY